MNVPRLPVAKYLIQLTFWTGCMAFLFSCSTQKNTWITRTYHGITAHYNIYFNGNESFKEGLLKEQKAYKNDYTRVLSVFTYDDDNIAKSISGDMDRAIKKVSKIIALHSIKAKPELKRGVVSEKDKAFYSKNEYNPWMVHAYLLMGKAYFYKHDYKLALETFRFMVSQFNTDEERYDAWVWIARLYIETAEMKDAKNLMEMLDNDQQLPKRLVPDLNATWAHYYIRLEDYKNALPRLEKAVKGAHNKSDRIRLTYILAQLYSLNGLPQKAIEYYTKVIHMNPPYETTFNARISMAANVEGASEAADYVKKQLFKLAKDQKNKDYLDQIYYALGNLSFKENNVNEAISYYAQSAQSSVNNNRQKALSYIAVADIYFNRPDYVSAAAYYDSASGFVDQKSFKNYDLIMSRARNLSQLATDITTVQFEDSVQVLSHMDKEALNKLIDKAIEKVIQKEAEERQREADQMLADQINAEYGQTSTLGTTSTGKWYFYNQTVLAQGAIEFKRKWGTRKLEDNWRRLNKNVSSGGELTAGGTEGNGKPEENKKTLSNKTREYYLQNIPFTDSLRALSDQRIEKALFDAGTIYMENLKEPVLASKSFEDLLKRFPNSALGPQTLYNLYNLYTGMGKGTEAALYKDQLSKKYPDSYYARVLVDPDYVNQLRELQNKPQRDYEQTYARYLNKQFADVIRDADSAIVKSTDTTFVPKYLYLKALSLAQINRRDSLRSVLNKLIALYPRSEAAGNAQIMIDFMDNKYPEIKEKEEEKTAAEIYHFDMEQPHDVSILIPSAANMSQLVFNIINFNLDQFEKLNLNVTGESLGKKEQLVVISRFSNGTDAMNYLGHLMKNDTLFHDVNAESYSIFVISEQNLGTLKKDQVSDRYLRFYTNNYHPQ